MARCTKLRGKSWIAEFRWRFCRSGRRTIWRAVWVSPDLLTKFFNRFTPERASRSTLAWHAMDFKEIAFWKQRAVDCLLIIFRLQRRTKQREFRQRKN